MGLPKLKHSTFHSFTKIKVHKTQGLILSSNSTQRQSLNHGSFRPIHTRFAAAKHIQASSTKSSTLRGAGDPFSEHEWRRSANRQAKLGRLPAPSLPCTREQTAKALMLCECVTVPKIYHSFWAFLWGLFVFWGFFAAYSLPGFFKLFFMLVSNTFQIEFLTSTEHKHQSSNTYTFVIFRKGLEGKENLNQGQQIKFFLGFRNISRGLTAPKLKAASSRTAS